MAGMRSRKIARFIKKKKWIAVVAALLAVIIALLALRSCSSEEETETVTGSVETVETRSIANSVSGNGTVTTAAYEDVSADVSGLEVSEVLVEEGQVIEAGQVIAVLDTSPLQENINALYQDIADARSDQAEQDADYDKQITDTENSRGTSITSNYNKMVEALDKQQTAQADYDAAVAERDAAKKDYDDYEAQLAAKQQRGETITMEERMTESNLSTRLQTAETKVTAAKSSLDTYQSQAQTYYDNVTKSYDDDSADDVREGKNDYDESVADRIEDYEDQIDEYQEQIHEAHLISTISGVITALNVTVGDTYNGGTAATIKNLDAFVIEAQIDEYDIADVQVGQNALIKTDATRDDELSGVVSYVALTTDNTGSVGSGGLDLSGLLGGSSSSSSLSSLTGSSASDSATYLIKIKLNEMDDRLRIGMTARVSVLTEEAEDVLSLPYDALQADEDGSIYVYVVTAGGTPEDKDFAYERADVTVGLQGTYYVEVSGDKIAEDTRVFVPADSSGTSISEILDHMGADAGV